MRAAVRTCRAVSCSLVLLGGPALGAGKIEPRLARELVGLAPEDEVLAWVFFADKGPSERQKAALGPQLVSERCLRRRAKVLPPDRVVDESDLPV